MIRIVLADDHPVVREGIRGMLTGYDDIDVVGQAASGPEAVVLVATLKPDLVLMDLRMPGGDGVAATREARRPVRLARFHAGADGVDAGFAVGIAIGPFDQTEDLSCPRFQTILRLECIS